MGYAHVNNLYKDQRVLQHKRGYALEKVHGTSAAIHFEIVPPHSEGGGMPTLKFHSGGESHDKFVSIFDQEKLRQRFVDLGQDRVSIFGEAYGGKQQRMSATYGPDLCFIAFEVRIGETWLNVPKAHKIVEDLGLEFVPYEEGPMDVEWLDSQRDADSIVAIRRGMGAGKKREGIVIKPLDECVTNNGQRVMAKHKRDDFGERATPQPVVDVSKLKVLQEAQAIADEWVTPMRLEHVLDKIPGPHTMESTRIVISAMLEDVYREAAGEVVESKAANAAIGKKTAELFKNRLQESLREV